MGDILKLTKNQRVPADMLFLHTTDPSGTIFVRTDQLDGETDWKVRESVKYTQKSGDENINNVFSNGWRVIVEQPNDKIYDFKGNFYGDFDNCYEPLRFSNTIWANMRVVSGEVMGIVIYTGKETRISQNNKKPNSKHGKTDEDINKLSKILFVLLAFLTIILFLLAGQFKSSNWYLFIIRTFILLSSVIPISMKVNLDFAKLQYSLLINKDELIKGTVARNSSIPEELGRIEYLLSDKTGTLTKNEMIFKVLRTPSKTIESNDFDDLKENLKKIHENIINNDLLSNNFNQNDENIGNLQEKEIHLLHTMNSLILCNNVSPITDNGERILQAASPDEVALVNFVEKMGYELLKRKPNSLVIKTPMGKNLEYKILENFPFSSARKRMGIIVKCLQSEKLFFFLKGADVVIREKVSEGERLFIDEETEILSNYGLRTLVLTYKKLSDEYYKSFVDGMKNAAKDLKNRNQKEENCILKLEQNMKLLGVTGVEDILQEEIKSTMINLREAGIKIWMLTGDKLETAKCIAISTGFKTHNQKFFEISNPDKNEILDKLLKYNEEKEVLVINGKALEVIFSDKFITYEFFEKTKRSISVVLCRCAPKQKAQVAAYFKNHLKKVVCCIGDGGNDVGMIQNANIGIGIEGKEGLQASLASDFSVLKFKYILNLFLWHGRLSYNRTSLLTNFVIHRGLIITFIEIFFMISFYYVSINIYNGYLTLCYATIFTNFPVFALIWDIDIPMNQAFNYPTLYSLVQKGSNISHKVFFIWLWKSVFQAGTIYLLALYFFDDTYINIVTITFTALIMIEYLNIYSTIRTWHKIISISIIISAITYFISLFFLKNLFLLSSLSLFDFLHIAIISLAAWLPVQIFNLIKKKVRPSQIDKVLLEADVRARRKLDDKKRKKKGLELVTNK